MRVLVGHDTKGTNNRLTLSHRPATDCTPLNEVAWKLPCGLAGTRRSRLLKRCIWLWITPCIRYLAPSRCGELVVALPVLAWHGILLVIQLTVPPMLILLDSTSGGNRLSRKDMRGAESGDVYYYYYYYLSLLLSRKDMRAWVQRERCAEDVYEAG